MNTTGNRLGFERVIPGCFGVRETESPHVRAIASRPVLTSPDQDQTKNQTDHILKSFEFSERLKLHRFDACLSRARARGAQAPAREAAA